MGEGEEQGRDLADAEHAVSRSLRTFAASENMLALFARRSGSRGSRVPTRKGFNELVRRLAVEMRARPLAAQRIRVLRNAPEEGPLVGLVTSVEAIEPDFAVVPVWTRWAGRRLVSRLGHAMSVPGVSRQLLWHRRAMSVGEIPIRGETRVTRQRVAGPVSSGNEETVPITSSRTVPTMTSWDHGGSTKAVHSFSPEMFQAAISI